MRTLFIVIFSFIIIHIYSQESPAELVTDRPDQTESSITVPHKSLQIETGFVLETKETYATYQKSFAYNTTLLRYGLMENFELRLGLEYLGEEIAVNKQNDTINTPLDIDGLSPLYAGFKVKIADEDGWKPEIAFLGGLVLPFTANKDFVTEYAAASFRFSLAHTLSDHFSLGYNLGAEWDGESAIPGYYYSLALGIGLTDKLGMYVEGYGLIPENGDAEHLADAGLTYLVLPNLQLDISGGVGLVDETIDNFIGFGLSWRIPE